MDRSYIKLHRGWINSNSKNRTYVRNIDNYLNNENKISFMLENIINSKVKVKIIGLFSRERESLHVSEVARIANVSKSRASECLKELAERGLLSSKIIGRNVIYSLASNSLAETVVKAFTQDETVLKDICNAFVKEIKGYKPISVSLFGSALKKLEFDSDIDFFIVTNKKNEFYQLASKLTEEFGFRISVLAMSEREFKEKARKGEEFILNVLANHRSLYGKNMEELVW